MEVETKISTFHCVIAGQCTVVFRGSVDISFSIENVYTNNPLHNTYLLKNLLHVTYLMKNLLHNISCDEKSAT